MTILNVMWSSGPAFASVHKVHRQVLEQVDGATPIKTWLLQGNADGGAAIGETRMWHLTSSKLKGKHVWGLLRSRMQARFYQALNDSGAQVVLLDGLGAARALLPELKKLPQVRAVVLFHGETRFRAPDRALFAQFSAAQLMVAAVSQTLADRLVADLQVPVLTLGCALDPVASRSRLLTREQARTRLQLPLDDTPVVGAVGRLVNGKGFACLIDAFAKALTEHPRLQLVILGEGQARPALQAQIQRLGLHGKVLLPGYLDDAANLYRAFDWVAIPSIEEGLGLALQEAVLAGVPVLCSELAVFREQLGEAGRYVAMADAHAWHAALVQALHAAPEPVALAQYAALSPDSAWRSFSQAARELLSCRQ
ncbi:Glycosyl transferases group 1 [Pseudomonas sp. ok272]|uniref:glycosyltransferase n=1 Tax=unclassified Pseudomonas TaxID=196821 RepID=UPI0008B83C51|nr:MULTISPECIES: glycosyltransferase [unclassified Pseudomonas]SEM86415.1 Glycosyl transferases group 1 [Pseudomonas sp. ok272]SFM77619.1 Glycosyl transferases group 1 [Pseudomonas sp. ok602]